jgi:hypothetical protein
VGCSLNAAVAAASLQHDSTIRVRKPGLSARPLRAAIRALRPDVASFLALASGGKIFMSTLLS